MCYLFLIHPLHTWDEYTPRCTCSRKRKRKPLSSSATAHTERFSSLCSWDLGSPFLSLQEELELLPLYMYHLAGDFGDKHDQAMAPITHSLESLQRQMNSLVGVVLQIRRAVDLITVEHGGPCVVLGEECCLVVNESSLMEQNVKTLKALCKDLLAWSQLQESLSWFHTPLFSWFLPMISLLIMLCFILLLAPCLIQFLWQ